MGVRTIASLFAVTGMLVALGGSPIQAASADPHALFARERRAEGGEAWRAVTAMQLDGDVIAGGSPSPFSSLADHRTGLSRTTTRVGSVLDVAGFDGVAWDFQGAAVTEQTLPGLRADNITQGYVTRDGWWNRNDPAEMTPIGRQAGEDGVRVVPRGGSAIDVFFNRASGLIDRTIAHTDGGAVTTLLDDYRTAGDVVLPFRQRSTDATGAEADSLIHDVRFVTLAPAAFARPHARSAGRFIGARSGVAPMRLSGNPGAILVDIHAAGKPATVIFDSGGANYFTPAAARRLHLHRSGGLSLSGAGNGSLSAQLAQAGTIVLGNAALDDQHAIVAPLPFPAVHLGAGMESDGLVGAEFLQAFRTTFDFDASRIHFESFADADAAAAPPPAVVLPMLSDGAHAFVQASVDGVSGYYLLDTGDSGDITVFRRFARAHGIFRKPGLVYLAAGGVGGHLAYQRYRAKTFALGGVTFADPPIVITDASGGSFASRSVAGNIGLRVISRYRITFDLARKTVTFVPNARAAQPFLVDRSGLSVGQDDPSAILVLSVVPHGPADAAGVHTGDKIVAIGGRGVVQAKLGLDDLAPLVSAARAYTLTVRDAGGTTRTVTIHPRDLLPHTGT